jgi:hypothetical protein
MNPEESLAAFTIQTYWRVFLLKRMLSKRNEAANSRIIIYLGSDPVDPEQAKKTRQIQDQCASMGYKTTLVDLVPFVHQATEKTRWKEISLLNYRHPVVFIGQHCIGEISDWDRLVESSHIKAVIEEGNPSLTVDFMRICLLCRAKRESPQNYVCEECGEAFAFFQRSY